MDDVGYLATAEMEPPLSPAERLTAWLAARFHGLRLSPFEIASLAIVVASALVIVGNVTGAVVAGLTGGLFAQGVAGTTLLASQWAEPLIATALLGAALLASHEAAGWCDEIDAFENTDDEELAQQIDAREALARLMRSRSLASAALALSLVTAAAAIAALVAVLVQSSLGGAEWYAYLRIGASCLGVVALSVGCVAIVLRVHRRCRETLISRGDPTEASIRPSDQ